MKRFSQLTAAAIALAVLAACAETTDDETLPADTVGAMTDTGTALPAEPVVVNLDEVDDSNISGEATATHTPTEATVTIVLKEGAQAGTSYPAHIHTGSCESGGPVAVELSPVSNLQSTKTVAISSLPANQPSFVQVHDPSGKPVACGDMEGHGDGASTPATTTTTH